jgi:enterochelin esterase-like enzyme
MKKHLFSLISSLALIALFQTAAFAAEHLSFEIAIDPAIVERQRPISGRLLIFMTSQAKTLEMIEPDFLEPRNVWLAGSEVRNVTPGQVITLDPDSLAFPAPFSTAPVGDYQMMALLDSDHSYTYNGMGPGDLYSAVTMMRNMNPASAATIKLMLTKQVPERRLPDEELIKLDTFESPSLTAYWGRPIKMRAGVVLPPSYVKSQGRRYPTVYVVHGYGGNHEAAWRRGPAQIKQMADRNTPEMIYVYLDASFSLGHHVFADSVNNGPWGRALTTEFIPHLEKRFRMDAVSTGRLLTGHSSGGWSTLWLQVNYPGVFGGTWSTSPDPVDFHNFTGPDLTGMPPQNFYRSSDGKLYNLVRSHGSEIMTMEEYAHLERVEGYFGGQMASFEAVFSPRGPDGQPMPIFDRDSGRIDPSVQKAWERYDISMLLRTDWARLGPRLRGRLHIIVGTADTFHLEAAVYLLRDTLQGLGGVQAAASETSKVPTGEITKLPGGSYIEFIEGRDHFDLYNGGLADRIAREMYAVARPKARKAAQSGKASD